MCVVLDTSRTENVSDVCAGDNLENVGGLVFIRACVWRQINKINNK